MAYSIMKALFNGRGIPWERRNTMSAERKELEKKIEDETQHFIENMSPDDCQRFEAFVDLLNEAALDEETEIHSHGFTLGVLLMLEVIEKKCEITNE